VLCGLAVSVLGASSLARAALIIVPVTLLTTGSAAGSLALARMARKPEGLDAGSRANEPKLGGGE
jgi:hypothetical protein